MIDYVDECFEPLYPVLAELPWGRRGFYANFMAQVHHFVTHSSRLLALVKRNLCDSVGLFRLILEETQRATDPAPVR